MVKNLPAMQERWFGSLPPGWGRSPREGNGNPPQYSCLENPKDRGAWWATAPGVMKSWTISFYLSGEKIVLFWCRITISETSSIFILSIYTSVATVMQKLLPFITQLNTHLAKNLENWTPDCHPTPMRWTDQWWHVWDATAFDVTAWPSQCKSIWPLLQFNLKSRTQCLLWYIWTKNM